MYGGDSVKVGSSCMGCSHCEYGIYDDYGCYEPGYYCDLDYCVEDLDGEPSDLDGYGVEE